MGRKHDAKMKATECCYCKEPRPDPREALPPEWQFVGKPDDMGGLTTHLTCSKGCRWLAGLEPGPFDM